MIKYIVNEEKQTVVAVIKFENDGEAIPTFKDSNLIFDDLWMALRRLKHRDRNFWGREYYKRANKMYFPKYMSAKAKCAPNDVWSEDIGKELARQRLTEKIHNYRRNSYKIITDLVKEINNSLIE